MIRFIQCSTTYHLRFVRGAFFRKWNSTRRQSKASRAGKKRQVTVSLLRRTYPLPSNRHFRQVTISLLSFASTSSARPQVRVVSPGFLPPRDISFNEARLSANGSPFPQKGRKGRPLAIPTHHASPRIHPQDRSVICLLLHPALQNPASVPTCQPYQRRTHHALSCAPNHPPARWGRCQRLLCVPAE